jgi:hypothetical protein
MILTETHPNCQVKNNHSNEDFAIARFIKFLSHIRLKEKLASIPDHRVQKKCTYEKTSLLLWALSTFFFRQESKNSLDTTIADLPSHKRSSLLNFLGIKGDSLPRRDCVDDYLSSLDYTEINELMIEIFSWAKTNKVFYNHAETLLPNNSFHLGVDGFWVHKYSTPHTRNEKGENICPFCLPRVHNKGKPEEKTYWVHAFVTFVLVFPGGVQFPIYVYPLKATQVDVTVSDEKLKQECELQAAHKALPELKTKLGRIHVTFLGDSLYANEPMIKLLNQLFWDYLIVRQPDTFKTLGRKCDELDTNELYQEFYRDKENIELKKGKSIERTAKWFNNVAFGKESFTNVLRFIENTKDEEGNIIKKFQTEWLSNLAVSKRNWRYLMGRGRMRSDHEDVHNTLKNRGFAAKHDYARANPNLWLIWKLLMFVAFFIFELFSSTILAKEARGKRSWMKFASDLLQQLVEASWELISRSRSLLKTRIQFRYDFAPE